jgi:hypothetical protein
LKEDTVNVLVPLDERYMIQPVEEVEHEESPDERSDCPSQTKVVIKPTQSGLHRKLAMNTPSDHETNPDAHKTADPDFFGSIKTPAAAMNNFHNYRMSDF